MVTIGLVGLPGSGRRSIANVLAQTHGYTIIDVRQRETEATTMTMTMMVSKISFNDEEHKGMVLEGYEQTLDHVTQHWQGNFVVPVLDYTGFFSSQLLKRPFFILVHVVAPSSRRHDSTQNHPVEDDDQIMFSNPGLHLHSSLFNVTLINDGTLDDLETCVAAAFCPGPATTRFTRPSWDSYFLRLARLAELRSNCMKRRVGAVLVRDNRVASTGYNGTPRGLLNCGEGGCARCNNSSVRCGQALHSCLCLHAEENAIIEAGRSRAQGATLYCTTRPCLGCAKKIVQVGITRVVWERDYSSEHDCGALFTAAGIVCEQVNLEHLSPSIINAASSSKRSVCK